MVFGWFVSRWEKSTMLIKRHKSSDGKLPPADTLVHFLIVFPVGERLGFFRFWKQVRCVYLTERLNQPHQKHAEAICLFLSELLCLSFFCFFLTTLIIIYLGTASLFRRTEQQARKYPQSTAISYIFAGFDPRREKKNLARLEDLTVLPLYSVICLLKKTIFHFTSIHYYPVKTFKYKEWCLVFLSMPHIQIWLSSRERTRVNVRENAHEAVVSSSESMTNPDPVKAHLVDA